MYKTASTGAANSAFISAINGLSSKWSKRWVWVSSTRLYYSEHPTPQPEHFISLSDITVANTLSTSSMEKKSAPRELRSFGWTLQSKDKEISWAAPDAVTRDRFVAFLNQHHAWVRRGRPAAEERRVEKCRLGLVPFFDEDSDPHSSEGDEDDIMDWEEVGDDEEADSLKKGGAQDNNNNGWDLLIKRQLDRDVQRFTEKRDAALHGFSYDEIFAHRQRAPADGDNGVVADQSNDKAGNDNYRTALPLQSLGRFLTAVDDAVAVEDKITGCAIGLRDGLVVRSRGTVDSVRFARCSRIVQLCCKLATNATASSADYLQTTTKSDPHHHSVSIVVEEDQGRCTFVSAYEQFVTVQICESGRKP